MSAADVLTSDVTTCFFWAGCFPLVDLSDDDFRTGFIREALLLWNVLHLRAHRSFKKHIKSAAHEYICSHFAIAIYAIAMECQLWRGSKLCSFCGERKSEKMYEMPGRVSN
jgi:hypothetical protein